MISGRAAGSIVHSAVILTREVSGLLRSVIEGVLGRILFHTAVEIVVPDDLSSVMLLGLGVVAEGGNINRPQVGDLSLLLLTCCFILDGIGFSLDLNSLVARPTVTASSVVRCVITGPPVDTGSAAALFILGCVVLPSAGHSEHQLVGLNTCVGCVLSQCAESAGSQFFSRNRYRADSSHGQSHGTGKNDT